MKFRFLRNKYYRWYRALTANDDDCDYVERHHRIPRRFGGRADRSNIVRLSARKHFLAHWLLTKCTRGEAQRLMLWAFACMCRDPSGQRILSSWQYALAKAAYSQARKGQRSNFKGRRHSEKSLAKIREKRRAYVLTSDHKTAISKGMLSSGKKSGPPKGMKLKLSAGQRAKRRLASLGRPSFWKGKQLSKETRAKMSAARMGNAYKLGFKDPPETLARKRVAQLRKAVQTNNKLGLKGVWKIGERKWRARCNDVHLGVFNCPAAAHFAYLIASDQALNQTI